MVMSRNYRIVIGAFAALMLLLLIRSSTTVKPVVDISKTVSESTEASQEFNTLPVNEKPGWIDNKKPEPSNTNVEPIKTQSQQEQTPSPTYSAGSQCNKDHQYIIMIDAGSTGSRVHVYEFDVCAQPPLLIEETFKMLKPGLSSFDTDAAGAARSLDPLLERALEVIPEKQRGCSPVSVKATAGLRMLGVSKSDKILEAVREHLEKDYPFPVVEKNGISIMSGEEEGVFAWVTTNYLLGNIGGSQRSATAAVFDLGGGSTQIVFEPTFPPSEKMLEGEHKYELKFGNEIYTLYQFSHLGYGLMEGRKKINSLLVETAIREHTIPEGDTDSVHELVSPCLPPKTKINEEKVKLANENTYLINFSGPVNPAGPQCRFLAEKILNKDAECAQPPCSFNGVHQPSLVHTFKETNDLYVFSYFYDKTQPLGLPLSFKLDELVDLAKMVCNGEEVWKSVFSGIEGSIKELQKEPRWCQDLSLQVALLHTGYDIPLYRELKTAKTINNNELGWCLGASLPLIDSDQWKCRLKQADKTSSSVAAS